MSHDSLAIRSLSSHFYALQRELRQLRNTAKGAPTPLLLGIDDLRDDAAPHALALALPRGSILLLRGYDHPQRRAIAFTLRRITAARHVRLLLAGDPQLACAIRADGMHLPRRERPVVSRYLARRQQFFLSFAAHKRSDLAWGQRLGFDLALLSPVFPTATHPEKRPLGLYPARAIAAACPLACAALGGITPHRLRFLHNSVFAGVAVMQAWKQSP